MRRLWNRYPRETVNPSLDSQATSLMLKMRFLGLVGHKYEKSWSFGHGVGWNVAKIARCAGEFCVFRGFFLERKSAFNACKNCKKISRSCVGGSGYHIKLNSSLFYLVGPDGPPKKRLSYVNFSLDFGNGIVLEKGLWRLNRQRNERNFSGNGRNLDGIFPGSQISGFWDFSGIKIPGFGDFFGIQIPEFSIFMPTNPKSENP